MEYEELMKAASLVSSENKDDIVRGLGTAEKIEKESIDFYSHWTEKAQNSELKDFFRFMVNQEKGHLAAINKLKESIQDNGEWLKAELPKEDFKVFAKKDWDKDEEGAVTAILFALWKEKEAEEFYRKAAEKIRDEQGRAFFNELAEFEKGHAEMLGEFVEDSFYSHELIMG